MFQIREYWVTYCVFTILLIILAVVTFDCLPSHLYDADDLEWLAEITAALKDPADYYSSNRITPARPPVDFLFAAGFLLWGDTASAFHILQICIHLVISLLVVYTLRCIDVDLELSLLTSLLFFMNVAHFRAIHWIACLNYLLAFLFGLIVLVCYTRFLRSYRTRWIVSANLMLVFAVLSHPSVVSIAPFCTYLSLRRMCNILEAFRKSGSLILSACVSGYLTYWISPDVNDVLGISANPDLVHILRNLFWFVSRLITSAHWLLIPLVDEPSFLELSVGFFACAGVLALYRYKVFPAADWAIWSLLTILPFINHPPAEIRWFPVGPSRQLYFASLGSCLILACLLRFLSVHITKRWRQKRGQVVYVSLILCVIGCSFLGLKRSEAMSLYTSGRSNIARGFTDQGGQLLARALDKDADLVPVDGYLRFAMTAFNLDENPRFFVEKGLKVYEDAPLIQMLFGATKLMSDPSKVNEVDDIISGALNQAKDQDQYRSVTAQVLCALGFYFQRMHKPMDAAAMFTRAIQWRSDNTKAYVGLGNVLYDLDRTDDAVKVFQALLDFAPDDVEGLEGMGVVLYNTGQHHQALEMYQKLAEYNPPNAQVQYRIALIHNVLNQKPDELHSYARTVALDANHLDAWKRMGNLLFQFGQMEEALSAFREVVRIAPDFDEGFRKLAHLMVQTGDLVGAKQMFLRAIQVAPNEGKNYWVLADFYEKTGAIKDAISTYEKAIVYDPNNQVLKARLAALQKK